MKILNLKKVLFGLAVSLVLAMAIGSFAIGEAQTPVTPQVAATNDEDTGAFDVTTNGEYGSDKDYNFETTTDPDSGNVDRVLYIHPKSSDTKFEIKNKDPETETKDRIEITAGPNDVEKTVNITLNGVNININDGSISTHLGAVFKIAENAEFNVNITLADNSKNYLTSDDHSAGLEKNDDKTTEADIAKLGTLTIGVPTDSTAKNGMLEANGGDYGAGIGGGDNGKGDYITITGGVVNANGGYGGAGIGGGYGTNGSNITISGGEVTATGGQGGAGIGCGLAGIGSNITITGGKVKAYAGDFNFADSPSPLLGAGIGGGFMGDGTRITISGGEVIAVGKNGGAGIGGGTYGNGSNITISGGSITATGGYIDMGSQKASGAGIGSGAMGTASGNKLNGNAVVLAISGEDGSATGGVKPQLDGFVDDQGDSLITQGIAFTGVGDYEFVPCPDPTKPTKGTWVLKSTTWNEGEQYGNVTITEDITFPAGLKIDSTASLTIGKNAAGKEATLSMEEGKKLTVEGSLINEGVINIPAENLICNGNGKITTLLNYDPQGGTIKTNDDNYITYQDASGTKKYENLPEAIKEGYDLEGWHTEKTGKEDTKVDSNTKVLLNQHMLYANWVEPEPPTPTPPTPTPPGPEPTPTPPEPGPEPTPTPEPTPDPSVDPEDGDSSNSKTSDPFMGGMALALLGVATTGAVLVRKRK